MSDESREPLDTTTNGTVTVEAEYFRVLIAVFEWLTSHTEYPHRYNPILQAVLLEGATETLWAERVFRRAKYTKPEA